MKAHYVRLKGRRTRRTVYGLEKWCSICRQWWPIECFGRSRHMPDGRENRCKACRSAQRYP